MRKPIAIKKKNVGKLHRELGVSVDRGIPVEQLRRAKKTAGPAEQKRIQFAENARQWNRG